MIICPIPFPQKITPFPMAIDLKEGLQVILPIHHLANMVVTLKKTKIDYKIINMYT